MKLPHDSAQAAFQIGNKKFALFFSFAFVEVEDHELDTGILFRPGEVSCVTHNPGAENPFDLCTAHLQPTLLDADNIEDAALTVSKQILAVGDRILGYQEQDAQDAAAEGCCGSGNCCQGTAEVKDGVAPAEEAAADAKA